MTLGVLRTKDGYSDWILAVASFSPDGMHAPGYTEVVADSLGNLVAVGSLPQALAYNGDGTLATLTVTDGVSTWVQTYTYAGGKLTGISAWVRQ